MTVAHLQGFVDLLGGPQLDDEESSPPIWMSTFFSSCLGQSSQELYTNALEKDEKTVYMKAIEANTIPEPSTSSISVSPEGYIPPHRLRKLELALREQVNMIQDASGLLKSRHKALKGTALKYDKDSKAIKSELNILHQAIREVENDLIEVAVDLEIALSRACDLIVNEIRTLVATFGDAEHSASLLQQMAEKFGKQYDAARTLSANSTVRISAQELDSQIFLLQTSIDNLERRFYEQELESIVQSLENGENCEEDTIISTEAPVETASQLIDRKIRNSWKLDESEFLKYDQESLNQTRLLLEERLMPPLLLLSRGLGDLERYVASKHASFEVMRQELEDLVTSVGSLQSGKQKASSIPLEDKILVVLQEKSAGRPPMDLIASLKALSEEREELSELLKAFRAPTASLLESSDANIRRLFKVLRLNTSTDPLINHEGSRAEKEAQDLILQMTNNEQRLSSLVEMDRKTRDRLRAFIQNTLSGSVK